MYQNNYNGYYNPQPVMPRQQNIPMAQALKGHPVSSLEEARAASIDFDGSVFFFPDLANKKIYTKQINLDGTASLHLYEFQEIPVAETNYVTREEFNNTLLEIKKMIAAQTAETAKKHVNEEIYNF